MQSQHIGVAPRHRREVASLTPHDREPRAYPFISSAFSATFCLGYSQDTSFPIGGPNKGQAGLNGLVVNEKKIRRIRCPRASKSWSHSASQRLLQPVRKSQKKNSWSQIQRRSPLSRHTPANTSNSFWGQSQTASKTTSFDLNHLVRSLENSHKKLDAAANFSLNWSIRNNEGEELCAYTSRPSPLCTLSQPAGHQNPKRSQQNPDTTNSAISNVTSSPAPTPVCLTMTKTHVSCQTVPLRRPVSFVRRQGVTMIRMTAAHPEVAAPAHLVRLDAHKRGLTTRPSGQSFGSEGASC